MTNAMRMSNIFIKLQLQKTVLRKTNSSQRSKISASFAFLLIVLDSLTNKTHTIMLGWGKAIANYPYELAQDAEYQSHTSRLTKLWSVPRPAQGLNTNNK